MRKQLTSSVIFIIIVNLFVVIDNVYSHPKFSCSCTIPMPHINHVVRISPRPPGWPKMWLAREIIKSLNDNGLNIDQTGNVSEDEIDTLPADIRNGVKFSIRSDEQIRSGCVLEFEKKKDFETIQGHYLELNKNNELHTWSFVKDNILVVIEGAMPEKEIQAYKAVLMNIK